ncbi:MAG TPA: DUF5671 domain-containing protein [Candidatus Nanoarchaeia archaeon]|nr:DUF5671 domain-containing protein [Candidatus Nanoarchaeia archaeon]
MNIKLSPKDFFLHIGIIVSLYVSSISLISLLFQVINLSFPDVLDYSYYYGAYDPYSAGIRWAIASLVIVFPIFILLSWLVQKEYVAFPEKREMGLRRWLTYLTLFLTGIAIAADLIVLINSFLSGEITTRFVLKVAVVLVTTGLIFGYYLWDMRHGSATNTKVPNIFRIVAVLIVVASLVTGFVVMGSPGKQRNLRIDGQRVSDLQSIQWQVISYWQQKKVLPDQLEQLNNDISGYYTPLDFETGQPYEYRVISGTTNPSFELCANFNLPSPKDARYGYEDEPIPVDIGGGIGDSSSRAAVWQQENNWKHGEGRTCFTRTIDPDIYPPYDEELYR